jgi:hypothetical protein
MLRIHAYDLDRLVSVNPNSAIGLMVFSMAVPYLYFKRKGWL